MKQELNVFLNALMYYSRIPTPKVPYSEAQLSKAFRYFPLVGIIVGVIGSGCFMLASMVMPCSVSILITIAVMLLLTGGIHEDGFADFFDGFGGGQTKENILRIMKDSHIGTYGVIALILLMALKYTSMATIPVERIPLVLISAQGISRVFTILLVRSSTYVREGNSKAQHTRRGVDKVSLFTAIFWGVIPMLFIGYRFVALYLILSLLFMIGYRFYLHRKIGGFTGDTLGALQQFTELFFYLTYISLPTAWTLNSIW